MQLEAIPAGFVSLGVLLGAPVAGCRKFADGFFCRLRNLPGKAFFRHSFPMLVFGRTTSFSCLLRLFDLFGWLLPASNGGGVAAYVSDKFVGKIILHQNAVNPIAKIACCKL